MLADQLTICLYIPSICIVILFRCGLEVRQFSQSAKGRTTSGRTVLGGARFGVEGGVKFCAFANWSKFRICFNIFFKYYLFYFIIFILYIYLTNLLSAFKNCHGIFVVVVILFYICTFFNSIICLTFSQQLCSLFRLIFVDILSHSIKKLQKFTHLISAAQKKSRKSKNLFKIRVKCISHENIV